MTEKRFWFYLNLLLSTIIWFHTSTLYCWFFLDLLPKVSLWFSCQWSHSKFAWRHLNDEFQNAIAEGKWAKLDSLWAIITKAKRTKEWISSIKFLYSKLCQHFTSKFIVHSGLHASLAILVVMLKLKKFQSINYTKHKQSYEHLKTNQYEKYKIISMIMMSIETFCQNEIWERNENALKLKSLIEI